MSIDAILADFGGRVLGDQMTTTRRTEPAKQALLKEFLDMVGEDEVRPKLTTDLIMDGGGQEYDAIPVRNQLRAELRTKAKELFK